MATRPVAAALLTLVLASGCVGTASPRATGLASPLSPAAPSADPCPEVPIRLPDGDAINLSGEWIGVSERNVAQRPGIYHFETFSSCLVWIGESNNVGEEPGEQWSTIFMGSIHDDFTITGAWSLVDVAPTFSTSAVSTTRGRGTLIVRIEPVLTDTGYKVRLVLVGATNVMARGSTETPGLFVTGTWVRPGDETLLDLPVD